MKYYLVSWAVAKLASIVVVACVLSPQSLLFGQIDKRASEDSAATGDSVKVVRLPSPVNLPNVWNSSPCMAPGGLELYLTSTRSGQWRTHVAKRSSRDEPFSSVEVIPNVGVNQNHGCISYDGLSLYTNAADIFVSTRPSTDAPWSEPRGLGGGVNGPNYDRWACISPNNLELYFTRSEEFEGEFSIYVARRPSHDSDFGTAQTLPANINNGGASAPHLSPDGLRLFFASTREGGNGGSDIWVATRDALDSPWGDPRNLGPQINGPESEWQPAMTPDGRKLLFSRSPNDIDPDNLKSEIWEATLVPE